MVQTNEALSLVLATGVLIFLVAYRAQLRRIPRGNILLAGFLAMYAGLVLTILENFFWEDVLNILEHVSVAASSILLAAWFWLSRESEGSETWRS